ncbi:MAG: hypothetical protein DSY43_01135 [Gammaproteobacteria bacterium]|nr:MAG: hypothetical protein DSY43_01135 [Gammaproteobacteria bacterium]
MVNEVFSNNIRRYVFTLWNWKDDVIFRHTGSNQGFNCFMFGSVKNNQGIVVMTNSENSFNMFDFIMRAVSQEYSWEYFRPEVYEPIEIEADEFKPYTGKYIWNNQNITISINSNQLEFLSDKITNEQLIPVAKNTFLLASLPLKVIFSKEDISKIEIYLPNGDYSEGFKIK